MLILLYQKEHKISLTIHTSTWTYSKGSVNLLRINCVLQTSLHTQRFGLTVSSRRCPSSFYESYRMGGTSHSTSLMPQFLQAVIRPQHDAFVDSKGSGNLLRIICISQTSLHIQRFAITVSFRRNLLTLRQLYPRAPSQPSVSPCRMGRTSASTSLMPQLV